MPTVGCVVCSRVVLKKLCTFFLAVYRMPMITHVMSEAISDAESCAGRQAATLNRTPCWMPWGMLGTRQRARRRTDLATGSERVPEHRAQ